MKLPNAQNAVIAPEKLKDYLLNPTHKKGGTKARLLLALGILPTIGSDSPPICVPNTSARRS